LLLDRAANSQDHLAFLRLRHPLPKNDYLWIWAYTTRPCSRDTEQGVLHLKNLDLTYQVPAPLTTRVKAALDALRRI